MVCLQYLVLSVVVDWVFYSKIQDVRCQMDRQTEPPYNGGNYIHPKSYYFDNTIIQFRFNVSALEGEEYLPSK